jgi:hypothetical protein
METHGMSVHAPQLSSKQFTNVESSRNKRDGGKLDIQFQSLAELTRVLSPVSPISSYGIGMSPLFLDIQHGIDMFYSVELNVGIAAACGPTIKPLVKNIIGSTLSLRSGSRSRKRTNNGYYEQSSSHAMGSMPRSRLEHEAQKYNVQIDAHTSLSASDGGSEENLASHPQRVSSSRILRTTEVIVQSEGSSDAVATGMGPKRSVDDRV